MSTTQTRGSSPAHLAETANKGKQDVRQTQREYIHAALALLLGPETEYGIRVEATRRIARQGTKVLPLVLSTLNQYPEILVPAWPWWPPQYEHCSRLLLYLSQYAGMSVAELLLHPDIQEPVGPVLWTSVVEAAGLQPYINYEGLLCRGLETGWTTVRYAAAAALAKRASKVALHKTTLELLHAHQGEHETYPVRLTCSYALMHCGEPIGLEVLMRFMEPLVPLEVRKATTFILATDFPVHLSVAQRKQLTTLLVGTLYDIDDELARQAAHALSKVAAPSILPTLSEILEDNTPQIQIIVLTLLEELAQRRAIRRVMLHLALPTQILPLLASHIPELRRQASYTLAACGGEYAVAALGTIVLNEQQTGHIEAIESLRILHGVQRTPLRDHVVRWLLSVLLQAQEETQATALDSLTYLVWQAQLRGKKQGWQTISQEILRDGSIEELLSRDSGRIRQGAVELLRQLYSPQEKIASFQLHMYHLLNSDSDSGVRASIAYTCGQMAAYWSIPGLLQALLDQDRRVSKAALHALAQIATPDDVIVVNVIMELAYYKGTSEPALRDLALQAQTLLKKWQKIEWRDTDKKLRSFR